MWHSHPVYPELMLFRTPIAPLFFGPLLQLGGSDLAEIALGLCFVVAILAAYIVGSYWGRRVGLGLGIALLLYPPFGALFHNVSSDGVFAFAFIVWLVFLCRTAVRPTPIAFAWHGAALFALVLIRPSALFLALPMAVLPFLLPQLTSRGKLASAGAVLATMALLLVAWSGYNSARYGDFTVSRTTWAHMPFYRLYVFDHLVRPENGPASRDLATAVSSDLLTKEPYRSYRIDLNTFFTSGTNFTWSDLVGLDDQRWGWHDDYRHLLRVALEAIRAHPLAYARDVAISLRDEFTVPFSQSAPVHGAPAPGTTTPSAVQGQLPPPPPGELIPASRLWWLASTPDSSISWDWRSLARPTIRFGDPGEAQRYKRLYRDYFRLLNMLPSRDGSARVARKLNSFTILYPNMLVCLIVGTLGVIFRRPRRLGLLLFLVCLASALVVGTALGEPATLEYRMPVDPVFVLFGLVGLIGAHGRKLGGASGQEVVSAAN
jgi:hypothetical protein